MLSLLKSFRGDESDIKDTEVSEVDTTAEPTTSATTIEDGSATEDGSAVAEPVADLGDKVPDVVVDVLGDDALDVVAETV
mgnify:FL=1